MNHICCSNIKLNNKKNLFQSSDLHFPFRKITTFRKKRKLAPVTKETQEEHPWNGQARNTSVPRINEECITQFSEEIEGRASKKLSQEFSRTKPRILGALFKLDEFLPNQQIRTHSGTVPETFRNTIVDNQGMNEDDSMSDPHPEAGFFPSQTTQIFGQEVGAYMVTGATERHDMVTGVTEEVRNGRYMVTAVQEIPYCSSEISSGKQKKARSTSQPQFRIENTPATIEADQILLAIQQLATNSNSANFNNNITKISKLPESLTTTMPTFDGKSENFELFEDLFHTSLKTHNQLTEEDKINCFHSLMCGDALQTFKNISSRNRESLTEILTVFHRKYVKSQSMATARHNFQQLVSNPANQKLIDFSDELQKLAKNAIRVAPQAISDQFIYAKMPPHLKKSINQAHLENGTYEQIVTHLERELELNSLEYPDETQMNTVTHKQQIDVNQDDAGNINSDTNDSNPNNQKIDRKSRTLYPPCVTCGKTNHSTERCYVGANAANRPLPWKNKPQEQDAHDSITGCVQATAQHFN